MNQQDPPQPRKMPYRIFLSYRRGDPNALGYTNFLYQRLQVRFPGQIFRDENETPLAEPYPQFFRTVLSEVDLILVCIADVAIWLRGPNSHIAEETDWIRTEIETGLKRNILVAPILFGPDATTQLPTRADLPEAGEPESIWNRFPQAQFHRLDLTASDWTTRGVDHLADRIQAVLKVSTRRVDQAAELRAAIEKAKNKGAVFPVNQDLHRAFFVSLGLAHRSNEFTEAGPGPDVFSAVDRLSGFEGPQLFRFAVLLQRHLKNRRQPLEDIAAWLGRMASEPEVKEFTEADRDRWLDATDEDLMLRVLVVLKVRQTLPGSGRLVEITGSLRMMDDKQRLPCEEFRCGEWPPGKDIRIVLGEPFRSLELWLKDYVGERVLFRWLQPRLEVFIEDGEEDQLHWPTERVTLDGERQVGTQFALATRLYNRHLDDAPDRPWERCWKRVSKHPIRHSELMVMAVWEDLVRFNPLKCGFEVENGAPRDASVRPAYLLRSKGCSVGAWLRRASPGNALCDMLAELNDETLTFAALPEQLLLRREVETGSSPWLDIGLLHDPATRESPYDGALDPAADQVTLATANL